MAKPKKKKLNLKGIVVVIILAVLVLLYYYHLSNKQAPPSEDEYVQSTAVQEVLGRNLIVNYPPTPKEVVRYYSEISKCFYNEEYTEEELEELAKQAQGLYDDDLIANKSWEQYLEDLQIDIQTFEQLNYTIESYSLSSSIDIENSKFKQDGYEWARVYCNYTLRQGTERIYSSEVFILRKDEDGHWKIFGWDLAD